MSSDYSYIFTGTIPYPHAHFGPGSGNIQLDALICSGTESSILDCTHGGIGIYGDYCYHYNDVGVQCILGE